jgi:4-hydroxybenzoate polyprenyltransferase
MIALFFITALSLRSWQIFILATLQQLYSLLTRKEFFVREWLRAHFLLYMLSHYFQLLILSWLTMTVFEIPSSQKTVYFGFALLLMAVVELARKIQEKDNDKAGDTYSANLGRARAISLFLVVSVTLAMYTTWILNRINADMRALLMVGFGIALILGFSVRYLGLPNKTNTKLLQGSSLLFYFLCATAVIVGA